MEEDASLDDFFAKKDKSKKKSKSKLTSSDILSKPEDTSVSNIGNSILTKKKKKKDKDRQGSQGLSSSGTGDTDGVKEEEEWNEFEEETEKDYSGLRIQNLQIGNKKDEEAEDDQIEEYEDEDGETRERKKSSQVPWKQVSASQQATPSAEKPEPPPPSSKEEPAKTSGKYVPPGVRSSLMTSTGPMSLRRKKQAPNLRSEEDFPTLGGFDGRSDGETTDANFERVQWGGRQLEDQSKAGVKLTLGNKYSALQD